MPRLLMGRFPPAVTRDYHLAMRTLFESVGVASGKRVILDSSKSAPGCSGRAIALARLCGYKVKVIHLVRDGRAVIWSLRRGNNRLFVGGEMKKESLPEFRGIHGWITANLVAELTGLVLGRDDNYLRMRYEDLVRRPAVELRRLGSFLDIDCSELVSRIESDGEFQIGHKVNANRLARASPVMKMRDDREWESRLPRFSGLLFWSIAGPMAMRYGYTAD